MRTPLPLKFNGFVVFNNYPLVEYFDGPEWETLPVAGWAVDYPVTAEPALEIVTASLDPTNAAALKAMKVRLLVAEQPVALFPLIMQSGALIQSTYHLWLRSQKDAASHNQCGLILRGYATGTFYLYMLILEGTGIQQASLVRSDSLGIANLYQQIIDPIAANPDPVIKNGDIIGLQVDTYDDTAGPAFRVRYSLDQGATWVEQAVIDADRADLIGTAGAGGIFLIGPSVAAGDEFTISGFKVISNEV